VLLQGSLNVAALEQSINEIVRRHEALRTCFPVVEGRPVQKIVSALSVLAGSRSEDLPETARGRGATAGTIKYPAAVRLGTGTLLRLTLLRLSTQEHVLLLTMHHIISDAWSAFIREVAALYEAFSTGKLCRQNSQSNMRILPCGSSSGCKGRCSILQTALRWCWSYQQIGRDRTFRLPLGQSTLRTLP